MSDSYKYVDPKYTYIDFQTGVLKNLQGITDSDVLLFFESSAVTKRLQELNENPIMIKGTVSLLEIHKYLFQDVYAWAGKQRTVDISKDGKQFFPISNFDTAFQYIDYLITEFKGIPKTNKVLISEKLAEILDNINYLHPFRDGNGRTQREFLRLLALEKKLTLNLNPPDNKSVYKRYMLGTIESDITILTSLISELIGSEN
jgi:cell filamentation protein